MVYFQGVSTLTELFKVGMILPCKFTEVDQSTDNKMLTLTINPKDVNSDLSAVNLRHGMVMYMHFYLLNFKATIPDFVPVIYTWVCITVIVYSYNT